MTAEAEIGKIYRGKVVTIKEFGAFVEFLPGKDGLVSHQRTGQFPRQADRRHRQDWRRNLGQVPGRRRKGPREAFAQSRDGGARRRNGREARRLSHSGEVLKQQLPLIIQRAGQQWPRLFSGLRVSNDAAK